MEVWKIIIPIVVFILCPLGIWYATKLKLKEIREKLYIYPKNGHHYLPLFICRMICMSEKGRISLISLLN